MTTPSAVRCLVVEDDLNVRDFVLETLGRQIWISSVVTAETVASFSEHAKASEFDLILLDITLPDGQTLEHIASLKAQQPNAKVLVFSGHDEEKIVLEAFREGADGYLLKSMDAEYLVSMIQAQLSGGTPMSPAIAGYLLMNLRQVPTTDNPLSEREYQVLKLLAKGCTYDDVSNVMDVKKATVATYVRRIYEKLEVRSKSEAIYEANRAGWLGLE